MTRIWTALALFILVAGALSAVFGATLSLATIVELLAVTYCVTLVGSVVLAVLAYGGETEITYEGPKHSFKLRHRDRPDEAPAPD